MCLASPVIAYSLVVDLLLRLYYPAGRENVVYVWFTPYSADNKEGKHFHLNLFFHFPYLTVKNEILIGRPCASVEGLLIFVKQQQVCLCWRVLFCNTREVLQAEAEVRIWLELDRLYG